MSQKINPLNKEQQKKIFILFLLASVFWIVVAINEFLFNRSLISFGIMPQSIVGFRGIFIAPFIHANFYSVAENTVPFIILGWLVINRSIKDFYFVFCSSVISSGFGTWLIGKPNTLHIGAGGVVFGFYGYCLFQIYLERKFAIFYTSIAIAIILCALLFFGILPKQSNISWESFLFGFIGGIIAAKFLASKP
ncbi:rhomboid family intramembrane serine protease [Pseudanabaena yagii]|uniref:Rhomboid family intramembrane serine protease n=1 Tax=Pseudanabaena yagii GIHE-NHR1 TaxID=2722753 RepID=A0ABX1LNE5_9CYAN|nr:rhomboid family intramembrane serine protease [Pseudanabaena yagii]NMF57653.1 rhomboid family intramembrane serine protease [Pseudanabaena yagii GIHE-NHR1]